MCVGDGREKMVETVMRNVWVQLDFRGRRKHEIPHTYLGEIREALVPDRSGMTLDIVLHASEVHKFPSISLDFY